MSGVCLPPATRDASQQSFLSYLVGAILMDISDRFNEGFKAIVSGAVTLVCRVFSVVLLTVKAFVSSHRFTSPSRRSFSTASVSCAVCILYWVMLIISIICIQDILRYYLGAYLVSLMIAKVHVYRS